MALIPKTLYLGIYTKDGRSGLVGKYVKDDETLEDEVFELAGETWEILAQAMTEGYRHLHARNLAIMTNDEKIVRQLNYPIGWDGYVFKDLDNPHIYQIACAVGMYYNIYAKFQKEDKLEGAKALWKQSQK